MAVVICAYTEERWDELVAAVASVRRAALAPSELVVVIDNNPALLERARAELGAPRWSRTARRPATPARATRASRSRARRSSPSSTTTPSPTRGGSRRSCRATRTRRRSAPAGRWCRCGAPHARAGSRTSSTGSSAARGPGWRRPTARSATRSGRTSPCAGTCIAEVGGFEGRLGRLVRAGKVVAGTADETEVCIRASHIHPDGVFRLAPARGSTTRCRRRARRGATTASAAAWRDRRRPS